MRPQRPGVEPHSILVLVGILLLLAELGQAQLTLSWNLTGSGSWDDPNNWDPNRDRVPSQDDTAIVNQGDAQIVDPSHLSAEADILRVGGTVGSLGTVSLLGGHSLTLYHLSDVEGDSGLIVGGAGEGVFRHVSGVVEAG
jgi:hypothetical protein